MSFNQNNHYLYRSMKGMSLDQLNAYYQELEPYYRSSPDKPYWYRAKLKEILERIRYLQED